MGQLNRLLKNVGKALDAKELQKIANKTDRSVQDIINQSISKGIDVKPGARDVFTQSQVNQQQQQAIANAPANTTPTFSYTPQGTISAVTYNPISSPASSQAPSSSSAAGVASSAPTASLEEIKAANALALQNLMNQGSAYGWDTQKEINRVSEAGETERTKLLNENRLAVTDAESRGRLDLQKIVNAGMQNIANIERGSRMAAGIYSMFNF